MSVRGVTVIGAAGLAALVLTGSASAHVVVRPSFLAAGETATLELDVPNERGVRMDGFLMRAPKGFRVLAATPSAGWHSAVGERAAVWHGSLAPRLQETFAAELRAPEKPGPVTFRMEQHYPDGGVVRWPVQLTVVPADEPAEQVGLALVAGLGGLVFLTLLAAYFWRRTTSRSLQER